MPSFDYMSSEELASTLLGWANSILFCIANIQNVLLSPEKCTFSCPQALLISSYTLVPINHSKSLVNMPGQTAPLRHSGPTSFQLSTTSHFALKPCSLLDILHILSRRHLWSFQTVSLMRHETDLAISEDRMYSTSGYVSWLRQA